MTDFDERITKLEQWIEQHQKEGEEYGDDFENRDKELYKRLLLLESENKMRQDTIAAVDNIHSDAGLEYEKRLIALEQRDNVMYKCPICSGRGSPSISSDTCAGAPRKHHIKTDPCHACQGKGIVWR